jgi:hypothetical protein
MFPEEQIDNNTELETKWFYKTLLIQQNISELFIKLTF